MDDFLRIPPNARALFPAAFVTRPLCEVELGAMNAALDFQWLEEIRKGLAERAYNELGALRTLVAKRWTRQEAANDEALTTDSLHTSWLAARERRPGVGSSRCFDRRFKESVTRCGAEEGRLEAPRREERSGGRARGSALGGSGCSCSSS
jgi:hypothetical protein